MKGTLSVPHSWGPWPGGGPVEFAREHVVAVGKLVRYNDARVYLMIELEDGRRAFVRACEQEVSDGRWLLRPNQSLWVSLPQHAPYAERWRRLDQMIGRVAEDVGCWQSGDTAVFGWTEVTRVGQKRRDQRGARPALLVEIGDGRRVFVDLSEQPLAARVRLAASAPDLPRGELERWNRVQEQTTGVES